jgi:S-(hydroxymethyl)glutathione dehydrogenase / alcohol dehydrogenase
MQGAVLRESPGWLEIADLQIDEPRAREVLIRNAAAGLCHSDFHFMDGKYPLAVTPSVMGHESAGVVEAVGSEVTYVVPGDHVVTSLTGFCGSCKYCLTGRSYLCTSPELQRSEGDVSRLQEGGQYVDQFAGMGSFAEQMLVHENAVVKIADDMPLDRAALLGCGVMTGLGAVFRTASVPPGSTVAIIGCGGVGLSCIQGAFLGGASRIVAVDLNDSKLDLAKQLGATDVVNGSNVDPVASVLELTQGGVEFAFEAIGSARTAQQAFKMLERGGTATVVGMIPIGETLELSGPALLGGRTLKGSNMGSSCFRVDIPRYVELYRQGRLRLDEMISERISLADVNDGFRKLQRGDAARSVIIF